MNDRLYYFPNSTKLQNIQMLTTMLHFFEGIARGKK